MRHRGSQEGSLRLRDGKWYGIFRSQTPDLAGNIEWKRHEVKLDATTERAARKELRERYVAKANTLAAIPDGACTLEQFIEARFRPDHIAALRKGGQIHYGTQLKHILPTLGAVRLCDINPVRVQSLLSAKSAAGMAAQSVRHIKNALSSIIRYAQNLGLYDGRIPTEGARIPSAPPKQRQALTLEQARLLLATIPGKYRPLIQFFLATGARASEAAGMRWQDVNLTGEPTIVNGEVRKPYTVHFRHAWKYGQYQELKTARGRRDVPMTSALWVELQTLREQQVGDSEIVFSATRGQKQERRPVDMHNLLARVIRTAGEELGMPWLNLHCLRHTTATWLDSAGAPMGQRVMLLGHADARTTMGYTHAEAVSQRAALEKATKGVN
jgi:integrase